MTFEGDLSFVQSDAAFLPLRSSCLDAVIANSTLEHIEADESVLSEVARVLRPGGLLVVTVPTDIVTQKAVPARLGRALRWLPSFARRRMGSSALAQSQSFEEYLALTIKQYDHARFGYGADELLGKLTRAGFQILATRGYMKTFGAIGVDLIEGLDIFSVEKGGEFGYVARHEILWGLCVPLFRAFSYLDRLMPERTPGIGLAVKAQKPPARPSGLYGAACGCQPQHEPPA